MRKLRIGMIGRPELQRGLGIQTFEFFRHIPCAKVLLVDFPHATGPRNYDAWGFAVRAPYSPANHTLPVGAIREFLHGLDIVFTAETPYDWRLLEMAAEMGVKTVIQGNPEFVRHGTPGFEDLPHPDEWWWPTSWRLDKVPPGPVVPVPMPPGPRSDIVFDGPLRILHVVGKRAHQDRNGTDILYQALRLTKEPIDVTIVGIDGELEPLMPQRNLRIRLNPNGVADRWDLYRNMHLLVLPRKYGGLCLPALEAASVGVPVLMPNCSPNEDFTGLLFGIRHHVPINMACGEVDAVIPDHRLLAAVLDNLAVTVRFLRHWADEAIEHTLYWSRGGTDLYLKELERVRQG